MKLRTTIIVCQWKKSFSLTSFCFRVAIICCPACLLLTGRPTRCRKTINFKIDFFSMVVGHCRTIVAIDINQAFHAPGKYHTNRDVLLFRMKVIGNKDQVPAIGGMKKSCSAKWKIRDNFRNYYGKAIVF